AHEALRRRPGAAAAVALGDHPRQRARRRLAAPGAGAGAVAQHHGAGRPGGEARAGEHTPAHRASDHGSGAIRRRRGGHRAHPPAGPAQAARVERIDAGLIGSPGRRPGLRGGTPSAMKLRTDPIELYTIFEFRIAHGSRRAHRNTLVRLEHDGIEGLGEASPSHYYGETPGTVSAALAEWGGKLGDDPVALDRLPAGRGEAGPGHGSA